MACFAHALKVVPIIFAALAYGQDVIDLDRWLAFTDSTDRLFDQDNVAQPHPFVTARPLIFSLP
jgi:hypothetical protein